MSTPADGRAYRYGENIDIALTFNTDVYVPEDDAWVVIRVGDAANGRNSRVAEYLSGSDTNRLVYRYQVEFDDVDANGVSVDEGGSGHRIRRVGAHDRRQFRLVDRRALLPRRGGRPYPQSGRVATRLNWNEFAAR